MNPAMMPMANDEPDAADASAGAGADMSQDDAGMTPGELCVPVAALAQPDEQEQMQPPAVGDKASAQIDYTVTCVEGDNAYITLDGVNGQPIGDSAPAGDQAGGGGPDDLAALKQQAAGMPNY